MQWKRFTIVLTSFKQSREIQWPMIIELRRRHRIWGGNGNLCMPPPPPHPLPAFRLTKASGALQTETWSNCYSCMSCNAHWLIDWLNGFYGTLFCTSLADGAEVLGSSLESPLIRDGHRYVSNTSRILDPQSPFYSVKWQNLLFLLTPAP
jgi:hypothetical protein